MIDRIDFSSIGGADTARLLSAQADAVPQILWAADAAGFLLFANACFLHFTGLTLAELRESAMETTIHPDDLAAGMESRDACIASGEPWDTEYRIRRHDGVYRWHLARCVPTRNEHGSVTHWFGYATDIDDLKQSQEALARERHRLDLALGASEIGTAVIDVSRQTVRPDERARAVLNLPDAPEIPFAAWQSRLVPADPVPSRTNHDALLRGTIAHYREMYRLQAEENGARDVAARYVVSARSGDDRPTEVTALLQDVSLREQMVDALRTSEARLSLAVDTAQMGFAEMEVASGTVTLSPVAATMVGSDPDALSMSVSEWLENIVSDDKRTVMTQWSPLISGEIDTISVHYRVRRFDNSGGIVYLGSRASLVRDKNGKPERVLGVLFDETEERETAAIVAEYTAELQELSEQRELAFRAARIGVWDWDVAQKRGRWSPEQRQLFGLPAQYRGEFGEFYEFVHPDDHDRVRGEMQAVLFQTADTEYEHEFRIVHGITGAEVWIEGRGRIYRDAQGEPLRIVGINMDISERKRAEADLADSLRKQAKVVESLQQSLLLTPPENAFPGIELGTLSEAARDEAQVGGDFYDAFAVGTDRTCLVVGDVTGKGLGAARFTAEAKFALRAYAQQTGDVSQSLTLLNRYICHRREVGGDNSDAFIALSAVFLNPKTGQTYCALGGMEPPLLYRAQTKKAEAVPMRGIVLGADPDATYDATAITLAPGDVLTLTTDGITEARNAKRRFFELDGIAHCIETMLEETPDETPERLAKHCLRKAKEWSEGKLSDDACLLIARLMGTPAP